MESIQILGKLMIKQIVTEDYKMKAGSKFQEEMQKVEEEISAYEKEMNKHLTELTLKGYPQVEQVRRQLNAEKEKLAMYREQLKMSMQSIAELPLGEIVDTGEGNFIQQIKVGDTFAGASACEILLKDDVVIEIKQG